MAYKLDKNTKRSSGTIMKDQEKRDRRKHTGSIRRSTDGQTRQSKKQKRISDCKDSREAHAIRLSGRFVRV